jgi:hypothetical protein
MSGWGTIVFSVFRRGRIAVVLATVVVLLAPLQAVAQAPQIRNFLPPQPPAPPLFAPFAPGPAPSGPTIDTPNPSAPPAAAVVTPRPLSPPAAPAVTRAEPVVPAGRVALAVAARYGRDAPLIAGGLIWRIYGTKPDATGIFPLIKEDHAAAPTFVLPPGNYVVDASFGLASAARAVQLRADIVHEVFEIPAGGVRFEGRVGNVRIPTGQISFEINTGSQFDTAERRRVAQNVMSGDVVLLPAGTYNIVSNYGDGNSVVRSDVQVEAGTLTDVVVTHRAAVITLKLVNKPGGEALANTQWTVLTPGGDVIKESIGAFPRIVLAEGDYHVIARNEGKIFQRDFKVITGVDGEVEVQAQ